MQTRGERKEEGTGLIPLKRSMRPAAKCSLVIFRSSEEHHFFLLSRADMKWYKWNCVLYL